jgi:hypothetical protein
LVGVVKGKKSEAQEIGRGIRNAPTLTLQERHPVEILIDIVEGLTQLNLDLWHNGLMPASATIELPESLHERLRECSEISGASIPSLIVQAVEDAYADTGKRPPKTGRRVTLPLIRVKGKLGPRFPVDENPHDLVIY